MLDLKWIAKKENVYPLKYYFNLKNNFNKFKDKDKDYNNSSLLF
jgi:hypothetical protein